MVQTSHHAQVSFIMQALIRGSLITMH